MNKRGQFYIIAAVVIVGLIIALGAKYTSINSTTKDDSTAKLLSEMQYEISQVIDNAVYNGISDSERNSNLDSLLEAYSYNNPDSEFVLIFGNKDEITSGNPYNKYYSLIAGQRIVKSATLTSAAGIVTITLSTDEKYDFPIKQQNLYLIVKTIKEDETNVATNN